MMNMVQINLRIPKELDELLSRYIIETHTSKSEAIRNFIYDALHQTKKNEERMLAALEKLHAKQELKQIKFEERLVSIMIKNSMYGLTNFNLLKTIIYHQVLESELSQDEKKKQLNYHISYAKSLSLYDRVDGVNSKENFDANMLDTHKRKQNNQSLNK